MRLHASLGALAAIGLLGRSGAAPPPSLDPYGAGICTPTATTTVFVTVPDTDPTSVPGSPGSPGSPPGSPPGAPGVPGGPPGSAPGSAPGSPPGSAPGSPPSFPPGPGGPGSPGNDVPGPQIPASPTFTLTLTNFPPFGDSPYTGPKPWETRTGIATRTVTVPHSQPSDPAGPGSPGTPGTPGAPGSGQPGEGVPGSPAPGFPGSPAPGFPGAPVPGSPGSGQPGDAPGSPGVPASGTPGAPGSGQPGGGVPGAPGSPGASQPGSSTPGSPSSPGSGQPGDGTPGAPGSGQPGDGTPSLPGSPGSGSPDGQQDPKDDCVTVITTTLVRTDPATGPETVIATFTVTFPDGSDETPGPDVPGQHDTLRASVITRTVYQPTLAPGQATVSRDIIVETFTVRIDPDGSDGSPSDGTFPPQPTPAPGPHGPVSVITTTLFRPRTIPGDGVVTDAVVATLTVTFPPSPSGIDPNGPSVTGIPGSPAPGSPGSPVPGSPGSPGAPVPGSPIPGGPGSPGSPSSPGSPGAPAPGSPVPGSPGSPGSPAPGSPGASLPGSPGAPAPGSPGAPGDPGSPAPGTPGSPGAPTPGGPGSPAPGAPGSPGAPAPGSSSAPGAPGSPTPGGPGSPAPGTPGSPAPGSPAPGSPAPGSPAPGSPGAPGLPGAPGSVTLIPTTWCETTVCPDSSGILTPTVRTHVTTIASSLAQQPPAPSAGVPGGPDGNPGDFVTVLTETVYHPTPVPGGPGLPTPPFDTIVATITATFPQGPATGVPSPGTESDPQGPGDLVSVVTTTIFVPVATPGPSDPSGSPGSPGSDGNGFPSDGVIVQTITVTIPYPQNPSGPAPGGPIPTATPGDGSGTGGPGPVITTSLYHTTTFTELDGKPTVAVDTFVATLTATAPFPGGPSNGPAPTGPHDGSAPYVTVITSTVTPSATVPGTYGPSGAPGAPGSPGGPGSPAPGGPGSPAPGGPGSPAPGGPDSPAPGTPGSPAPGGPGFPGGPIGSDGLQPTVIVFTSTIFPTGPASPDASGIPSQGPNADDDSVTVLSATFTLTAPPAPGATGAGDVQTVVQTFTYTFPSTPSDGGNVPGGQATPTLPNSGTGLPPNPSAPDAYGSAINTATARPAPSPGPSDDSGISGVVRLTSTLTGTLTRTVPAGYGDGSALPTDGSIAPSQTGGFSILPITNLPSSFPGQPADPGQFTTADQLPLPGQPSGTGLPNLPGPDADPNNTGVPGQDPSPAQPSAPGPAQPSAPGPAQPSAPGLPADASSKTTCTLGQPGTPTGAPVDGSSGVGPVIVPPQQTPSGGPDSLPSDDSFPAGYGFPTGAGPGQPSAGPSGDVLPTAIDPNDETASALPTVIPPTSTFTPPSGLPSGLPSGNGNTSPDSTKDCSTGSKTLVVTSVATTTFLNIVPHLTTTYTFPYQALVTVESTIVTQGSVPTLRRWFKRQDGALPATEAIFANTTTSARATGTVQPTEVTLFPTDASVNATSIDSVGSAAVETATPVIPVQLPICTGSTEVGNLVLDFDELSVGPLYNPYNRFWFSSGFVIAPPPTVPYVPTSGRKLLEFVPPVFVDGATTTTLDASQFGVGIDAASDCFRFNFHGANLGCDATGEGQFCEFTFTGYRFNATLNAEEQAMSQLVWVESCPSLVDCGLTPIVVEGFDDISSVLVTVRVDGQAASWWADDLRVGWFDNSCEAGRCRAGTERRVSTRILSQSQSESFDIWTREGRKTLPIE